MNERVKAILDFWFKESTSEEHFKRSNNFDNKIRNLFKNDYQKAIKNELEDWQDNPSSCLALVILLDQFSRNLFRDSPMAFIYDKKTRLIVNEAVDRGDLEVLNNDEKFFLILPLIHSEDISDHIFAHKLCDSFLKKHPKIDNIKKQFDYHTLPIKKFGRFPHRNKVLKRESTNSEKKFLSNPNTSW
jgi:uncharacterized protein (DUF924 family)|tara:strand:- start:290 stop:850 length:561 start_codon:yes stop_codon:yes gene_type:complete